MVLSKADNERCREAILRHLNCDHVEIVSGQHEGATMLISATGFTNLKSAEHARALVQMDSLASATESGFHRIERTVKLSLQKHQTSFWLQLEKQKCRIDDLANAYAIAGQTDANRGRELSRLAVNQHGDESICQSFAALPRELAEHLREQETKLGKIVPESRYGQQIVAETLVELRMQVWRCQLQLNSLKSALNLTEF